MAKALSQQEVNSLISAANSLPEITEEEANSIEYSTRRINKFFRGPGPQTPKYRYPSTILASAPKTVKKYLFQPFEFPITEVFPFTSRKTRILPAQ